MAENGSLQRPYKIDCGKYTSPFLISPNVFISMGWNENDYSTITSPTSILDAKPFSAPKSPKAPKALWGSRGVSLGLLDVLIDEKPHPNLLSLNIPKAIFDFPQSPADFGIKTRTSHVGSSPSPSPVKKLTFGCLNSGVTATEMELSEDYTRVISYDGPSPKTVHIFDGCIVERCSGCKKILGRGKDACIHRGEKAFCCSDCHCTEMLMEERLGNSSVPDEIFSSSLDSDAMKIR